MDTFLDATATIFFALLAGFIIAGALGAFD